MAARAVLARVALLLLLVPAWPWVSRDYSRTALDSERATRAQRGERGEKGPSIKLACACALTWTKELGSAAGKASLRVDQLEASEETCSLLNQRHSFLIHLMSVSLSSSSAAGASFDASRADARARCSAIARPPHSLLPHAARVERQRAAVGYPR